MSLSLPHCHTKVLQSCWNNLKASSCKLRFCLSFQHKYALTSRAQYTVHSAQSTEHSAQYTVHFAQYTVHSTQDTMNSEQRTVHSIQCTLHSTQCTVYCALCALCTVYLRSVKNQDRLTKSRNLKTNLHWRNFANFSLIKPPQHKLHLLPPHHFRGPNVTGTTVATA